MMKSAPEIFSSFSRRDRGSFREESKYDSDDEDSSTNKTQTKSNPSTYVGKKEDEDWWRKITPIKDDQTPEEMYRLLVENMGIYRWQNAQYVHIYEPYLFELSSTYDII